MTRDNTLKLLLRDFLVRFLSECTEHVKEVPIKKKQETQFNFKNNCYIDDAPVHMDDYDEFFSRPEIKQLMWKNENFIHSQDIILAYENIKLYLNTITASDIMDLFILNYLERVRSMKFTKTEFQSTFKDMMTFIKSDIQYVDYFIPVFKLHYPKIKKRTFGDVSLNLITVEQFKAIKEHMVGKDLATHGVMYNLKYVLNTSLPVQNNPYEVDDKAKKKFNDFAIAALLFHPGELKIGSLFRNFTPWKRNSLAVINGGDIKVGSKKYKLNNKKCDSFKNFYKRYLELNLNTKDWLFITTAIDRFISSINRNNQVDRIVDLNVSLESLFSSAGETSLKITNRAVTLISRNGETREKYWFIIKDVYKMRNDLLHGRQLESEIDENKIYELEYVVRTCIQKFLNFTINISPDRLKEDGKIKSKKNMRDYILNELDLCLINSTRQQDFLGNAEGVFTATW